MAKIPTEIEKLATSIAVGSIFCLGVFMILDAVDSNFFGKFELTVDTASFGVIAAIPTLAFLYVIGSLLSICSDFVFQKFNPSDYEREWEIFLKLAKEGNETLNAAFTDLYRKKKILEGSVAPFVILGIGVICERSNVPDIGFLLLIIGVTIIILGLILPFFTGRIQVEMERFDPNKKETNSHAKSKYANNCKSHD
ncbi:MAG: hypothetical protein QNJ48_01330 [Desulfobacterales bacterium]|nr:hypothetical protein [Desulfobacterales bacterium]